MYTENLISDNKVYRIWSLANLAKKEGLNLTSLPFSIRILLENLLRNYDGSPEEKNDILSLAKWNPLLKNQGNIRFYPFRVVMQDFTGIPALADLAAMRDAVKKQGKDGSTINPLIPVDLVVDHSVSIDYWGDSHSLRKNVKMEYERNGERYKFLKWAKESFSNLRIVPPGKGIIHQVNLEYLGKVVASFCGKDGILSACPDSLVGTDSHTTMINALGILGWGVGGIEAEAAMLGLPLSIPIPEIVGLKLKGHRKEGITATDMVLKITNLLRKTGVVGKIVEFFGPGLNDLSLEERATISNMAPEYGATCGIFPIDKETIQYMEFTGRDKETTNLIEIYCKKQGLWRDENWNPSFSEEINLDISTIEPSMAGPKRPQDIVSLGSIKDNFLNLLPTYPGVNAKEGSIPVEGRDFSLSHGDVVIAAITSCTNTSNPGLMIAAGLVARNAVEKGIAVKPWVKTSLAPGSQVVNSYLTKAGLIPYLKQLGFYLSGYGCTTCIGNSGPLAPEISNAIKKGKLITVNVLSGNRNFEGRIHPDSRASYLASPPLVVAYALAGTILIDPQTEALAINKHGQEIYLKDIWPSQKEIRETMHENLGPEMFQNVYEKIFTGSDSWRILPSSSSKYYPWEEASTYLRKPPFFGDHPTTVSKANLRPIKKARALAILPDSTTTDHISPAGNISPDSPAGIYLSSKGINPQDYNSFGSRRGNHEIMMRGTFGNIRLHNKMLTGKEGGFTRAPDNRETTIFEAAGEYQQKGTPLLIFAGKEYGTGSSRDWAAKGTLLLGVRAVIACSFERIHRSNLVGMGVLPLEFTGQETPDTLELTGEEEYDLSGWESLEPKSLVLLSIYSQSKLKKAVKLRLRIDSDEEQKIFESGGILPWILTTLE